jgi:hypothetical protein
MAACISHGTWVWLTLSEPELPELVGLSGLSAMFAKVGGVGY